ncbi:cell division/cell wall cluster transcriptional repressor MraZ [candidate division Kazan bacterium]|uniref:Transcriptional regulator MraZ n=1 Tax=candidate division Kazan bacterium TaxID=2202143 RepID=A0A420ZCE9_UNCK3|nr:MAG: cell division/cell wall cluster transcriptional repressor MraZ [candidate division Kazan bacterium]
MDNSFIGEYNHSLDNKGRLAIPAKFRSSLKKGAVVTKGLDGCLFMYTEKEWNKWVAKLSEMSTSQGKSRAFARLMLAGAMPVRIDVQGRINLPKYLIDFAKLKNNVVIAGLMNRLEIWDEKTWDKYKKQTEPESEKIAEELFV